VKFCKEAELVAIADIGVIFITWPEKAITLITSIETITQMSTKNVLACLKVVREVIRHKLNSSMVIGPAGIQHMIRRSTTIDSEVEMTKTGSESDC